MPDPQLFVVESLLWPTNDSLPEAWDADHNSSMNHCMLGHIQEWFNRDLAGIEPEAVAFRTFRVRPVTGPGVSGASAALKSPYGTIKSAWTLDGGVMTMDVKVPANTTAHVYVPGDNRDGGEGAKFLKLERGRAVFEVGSGTYHFTGSVAR